MSIINVVKSWFDIVGSIEREVADLEAKAKRLQAKAIVADLKAREHREQLTAHNRAADRATRVASKIAELIS